jgi:MoaA/NifB/PqqE/SkfB family radical SAM enzyme
MIFMEIPAGPLGIVWDMTYSCPLRCVHCYSESGRRPTRQLGHDELLQVTDAMISLHPKEIALSGGEPFSVPGVLEVAERVANAGIDMLVYTSGWSLRPDMLEGIAKFVTRVHVSVDGPTALVHDRTRGRKGAFDRAMAALQLLDDASRERRERGLAPLSFAIDCVVTKSNLDVLEGFCTDIAPRFPELSFLSLDAVIPIGLASRASFAEHLLPSDEEAAGLVDPAFVAHLQSLAPPSVRVTTDDHHALNPHYRATHSPGTFMQVEPDGEVRAMPIYEGTVGNILTESPDVLWKRGVDRWTDPVVVEVFSNVQTMSDWAAATRRVDYHFGSTQVKDRLDSRPVLVP